MKGVVLIYTYFSFKVFLGISPSLSPSVVQIKTTDIYIYIYIKKNSRNFVTAKIPIVHFEYGDIRSKNSFTPRGVTVMITISASIPMKDISFQYCVLQLCFQLL